MEREGRLLSGAAAQPRRLAVLALLARSGQKGLTREKLLGFLWADQEEERGRRALTQALYALRQELGSEEAITGAKDLRLNPDLVATDVAEFSAALAEGRAEEAVQHYRGPFLDGFHLSGAEEFERWVDQERQALAQEFAEVLRQLAVRCGERGESDASVRWWKRLAAHDPLDSRTSLALMRALEAAGDRSGALQHARIHELLLQEHLDLPPDRDVATLAKEIRGRMEGGATEVVSHESRVASEVTSRESRVASPETPASAGGGGSPVAQTPGREPEASGLVTRDSGLSTPRGSAAWRPPAPAGGVPPLTIDEHPRPHPVRDPLIWATVLAVLIAAGVFLFALSRKREPVESLGAARADSTPVVVVGRITDYTENDLAGALGDMLATNLARASGLRVVSTARMYELIRQRAAQHDTGASAVLAAARNAGATELVDGALYERDGAFRLDLRRMELETGDVREAWSVEGPDAFALADSATARIVTAVGAMPPGAIADVTTRSVEAWRAYEQGLRRFYVADFEEAEEHFSRALLRDPLFPMAKYYFALSTTDGLSRLRRLDDAIQVADRASERERLLIRAAWGHANSAPWLRAVAESLTTRHPDELEGHIYLAEAAITAGDVAGARTAAHEAIQRDQAGIAEGVENCAGCRAFAIVAGTYELTDSLEALQRITRLWTRLQPKSWTAWRAHAYGLSRLERYDEARRALARAEEAAPDDPFTVFLYSNVLLWEGRYGEVMRMLEPETKRGDPDHRSEARWWRVYALRMQGKFEAALEETHEFRRLERPDLPPSVGPSGLLEGLALFELGRYVESAAMFDSVSRLRHSLQDPASVARNQTWARTHQATALAAVGDTVRLRQLIEPIRETGARSALLRDNRLYRHAEGLLWLARRQPVEAEAAFREALFSPSMGYTRTNLELGRLLHSLGRSTEAVAVLQPALRGGLDGSPLYTNRTELRGLLGEAWLAAGNADSARHHLSMAAAAWAEGDPKARAEAGRWRRLLERR